MSHTLETHRCFFDLQQLLQLTIYFKHHTLYVCISRHFSYKWHRGFIEITSQSDF